MRNNKHISVIVIILFLLALGFFINGCTQTLNQNKVYTPKEVWDNRYFLLNKEITVQGIITYILSTCPECLGCPCQGDIALKINETAALKLSEIMKCSPGTKCLGYHSYGSCNISSQHVTCEPLDYLEEYAIKGYLQRTVINVSQTEQREDFYFSVESYEKV